MGTELSKDAMDDLKSLMRTIRRCDYIVIAGVIGLASIGVGLLLHLFFTPKLIIPDWAYFLPLAIIMIIWIAETVEKHCHNRVNELIKSDALYKIEE